MTAREMQIAFSRELSNINLQFEFPDIIDSDTIFYFINLAQDKYLKENYVNKASVKDNVEYLQKKIDDLKQLISRALLFTDILPIAEPGSPITPSVPYSAQIKASADGAIMLPLPSNYMYYIRSISKFTGTYLSLGTASWFSNKIVDHYDIDPSMLVNGFNTPIIRIPLVVLETAPSGTTQSASYIKLYKDSYSNLFNFELTYIRQPKKIILTVSDSNTQTTTCELAVSTHQEIVTNAAKMFIEDYKYKLTSK